MSKTTNVDILNETMTELGVPQDSKWRGLVFYMRSIKDYEFLSEDQKIKIQKLVSDVLKAKDFSEQSFSQIVKQNRLILTDPLTSRLDNVLKDISTMLKKFHWLLKTRHTTIKNLEEYTIEQIKNNDDSDKIIENIREQFKKVADIMEQDLENVMKLETTDKLTRTQNFLGIQNFLTKAIQQSISQQTPLSLIYMDIDNLKEFNDKHGRNTGDEALVVIASQINREFTSTDYKLRCEPFIGRYKDDDFVVLLEGTYKYIANKIANGLSDRLNSYVFVVRTDKGQILERGVKFYVNIGVTELLTDLENKFSTHHFLESGRRSSIEAKKHKTRVCDFDDIAEEEIN